SRISMLPPLLGRATWSMPVYLREVIGWLASTMPVYLREVIGWLASTMPITPLVLHEVIPLTGIVLPVCGCLKKDVFLVLLHCQISPRYLQYCDHAYRPPVGVPYRPPVGVPYRPPVGVPYRPPVGVPYRPPFCPFSLSF
uniref:Uncharacterized protein n=1 Tax=Salmo trutta TaxID=8032 RepID=A0A674B2D1_SALTR